MSDTQNRLFDVTDFGGAEPTARESRKPREKPELPVEPHQEPWVLMRNARGVAPYFHLVKGRNGWDASVALCDLEGTTITNAGVTQMIRCPECEVNRKLNALGMTA